MRICIISSSFLPEMNGVSTQLERRIKHFSALGHQVLMLCPDYGLEKEIYPNYAQYVGEIYPNVTVKAVPSDRLPQKPESPNFKHFSKWDLSDYIGDFKPEIIEVNEPDRIYGLNLFGMLPNESYGKVIAVDYAKERSIPVLAFYHTNFPAFANCFIPPHVSTPYRENARGVYQLLYNSYDLTMCSCKDAYDFLKEHGVDKVKYGNFCGYDDSFDHVVQKDNTMEKDEGIHILYVGRFEKSKGKDIQITLDIMREVQKAGENITLYLVGHGEDLELVLSECSRNDRVKYLGFRSGEELARTYNSADIYLSPYSTDTLGLTLLEAMARGVPVVAANEGGPKSLITEGYNGILCNTIEDFVNGILKLSADKQSREAMGKNARQFAQSSSAKACAENMVREYQQQIIRWGMQNEEV